MEWTTIVIAILGSGIINLIMSYVFKRFDEKNGVKHALRLIMKDRLRFLCMQYIAQKWIYADELDDLISMHACYHTSLEGNGYLDKLMERVKNLDIRGIGVR